MARRVLAVKPNGPWLVVVEGKWAVDANPQVLAVPLERSALWLLPLTERPRAEVEREVRALLGPGDPDFGEVLWAVIRMGLTSWSDYWTSHTMNWMTAQEIELFAPELRKIATGRTGLHQRTHNVAKRLLKQHGLWWPWPPQRFA
ncbi:hypothetical protein [Thermomonospora amylolytica]|uniref:hypothetical protein n=1 Tax=Thermomonospora amylolytica TaxID=1411117 RepID=UPI0013008013|nr:hypothetical protein [Thermomonospora amylolytica]